jgi:hypothetical protein
MTKERKRSIKQFLHFGKKLHDKFVHVRDWRFSDTAETAGWFDGDHLDRRIQKLCPVSINS